MSGARRSFGEAFEYQQTVPFSPLFMATLRAHPPVGDADTLRQLGSSADLRYWVVQRSADAIATAATERPVVVAVEDIHWADNGTLLALRSLATGRTDAPVLWVLTARTGAGGPALQHTIVGAATREGAHVLRLAPMAPGAVADMVADAVRAKRRCVAAESGRQGARQSVPGRRADRRVWTRRAGIHTAAGVRWPPATGCRDGSAPRMQQRLDLLSDAARQVVRVAAVLPDRFSAGLLAAMLDSASRRR